jgi:hypothetical protein
MGREAVSPEVAKKKVERANAHLQAPLMAGGPPSCSAARHHDADALGHGTPHAMDPYW